MNELFQWALGTMQHGLQTGAGMSIMQSFVGSFFALSGFHKLFHPDKHEQMVRAMQSAKIPHPRGMAWFVSGNEFLWGLALMAHVLVGVAAAGLFIILVVAWNSEFRGRIAKGAPYTGWPVLGKCAAVFCMAETIYAVALAAILLG